MRARTIILVAVSIVFAGVCTGLGFWQIRRLREKQNYNEVVASRRFLPAVSFDSLPSDTTLAKFRRVRLNGRPDYANEIIWTLRGRDGSPGVNIITPLRRNGNDTAILVDRGWIYSPDATHANLSRWKEADTLSAEGYVLPLRAGEIAHGENPQGRAFRALDAKLIRRMFPYPVAPYVAVLTTPSSDSVNTPPRVTLRPLDEGSHRSYAFQWFSFAAISIIGAAIFIRKT